MSMSAEHAAELKNEVAVVCCRTEAGTIISSENLEDPAIFPDLVDSGLLSIPSDCLKIGEAIGAKLIKTIDSLTPITPNMVEGARITESSEEKKLTEGNEKAVLKYNKKSGDIISIEDLENPMHFEKLQDSLLLELNDRVLTRSEVVGKKLVKNAVALTPVTGDMLEGFIEEAPLAEVAQTSKSCRKKIPQRA